MELDMYLMITVVLVLFGAIATIMIGNSKKNQEENPSYDKNTGRNWIRLTVFYMVSTVVGLIMFLLYIFK
jgi:uncharacterized BrkB/YihY/UPF0761 family membrane protein